jgi:hypothetical protein
MARNRHSAVSGSFSLPPTALDHEVRSLSSRIKPERVTAFIQRFHLPEDEVLIKSMGFIQPCTTNCQISSLFSSFKQAGNTYAWPIIYISKLYLLLRKHFWSEDDGNDFH